MYEIVTEIKVTLVSEAVKSLYKSIIKFTFK